MRLPRLRGLRVAGGVAGARRVVGRLRPRRLRPLPLLVDYVLEDGILLVLIRDKQPAHGVHPDTDAAEEAGDDQGDPDDVGVYPEVLPQAGAHAREDAATMGTAKL